VVDVAVGEGVGLGFGLGVGLGVGLGLGLGGAWSMVSVIAVAGPASVPPAGFWLMTVPGVPLPTWVTLLTLVKPRLARIWCACASVLPRTLGTLTLPLDTISVMVLPGATF
jgi:hypothetical protein